MDVLKIGDFADFAERHGGDWQRIAGASDRATVFQTWEWLSSWRSFHKAGKRFHGLVFQENGEIVGLAALMSAGFPTFFRTLRFVGNGGSDYLDVVALPGFEEVVCEAFLNYISDHRREWNWIDLQQIRTDSVAEHLAAEQFHSRIRVESWEGETCPYLSLPADWEAFRKGLGKKLRQNIAYYERALEKVFVVEIRTATRETLGDDLEAFFFLHQRRWNQRWMPGAFASRRERAFHAAAAGQLLDSGMLRLHTLSLDGEVQAALYCFQKGTRCYYYLGGFEPKFARFSIGTVLTAYAIRQSIEKDGATEFDFLRGDEGYKYKWGAKDRYNRRFSVTRPGMRSALLSFCGRQSLTLEQKLKSYMHRKHAGGGKGAAGGKSEPGGASNA